MDVDPQLLRVRSLSNMAAPIDLCRVFVREIDRRDGTTLRIHQSEIGDVGCVVWDAAIVLSKYLETSDFKEGRQLLGQRVLELGAGTGAVGLMAASYGAKVTLTDLPEFVPLMQLNIDKNKELFNTTEVEACALRWGQDVLDMSVDILLVADCIYYEESLEPLVQTVDQMASRDTTVLCCYEERTTGNKPELQRRFLELISRTFNVSEVPLERQDEQFRSEDIHILTFRKKPDS